VKVEEALHTQVLRFSAPSASLREINLIERNRICLNSDLLTFMLHSQT